MIINKLLGLVFLSLGYWLIRSGMNQIKNDDWWYYLYKFRKISFGALFLFVGIYLIFTSEEIF